MRVAILGGGFCGATVASLLDSNNELSVTLIDQKSYFEYNPGAHKCITNPHYQTHLRRYYSQFLPNTLVITEKIKEVYPSKIRTTSKIIKFDYAVLCMGNIYPIMLSNKKHVYKMTTSNEAIQLFNSLNSSKHVLIVGGGYLGVEIAGELATKRPDLHITLVHSHKRLLEKHPIFVSTYTMKFLTKRGVNILLNEKIVAQPKEHVFVTKTEKEIQADTCIWCTGINADTSYLKEFNPFPINLNKRIKVNSHLQVEGFPKLFSGGDITAIKEEKTAQKAKRHAQIIAKNIIRLNQNKPLIKYKKKTSPMVISIGDYHGIGTYGNISFYGILPGFAKWFVEWWSLNRFK